MPSIARLVADLQARGITLSLADGEIRYRARHRNALTAQDLEAVRARRTAIGHFLSAREAGRALRSAGGRPGPLTASVAQEMWWRFGGGPDEGKPAALNIGMIGRMAHADAAAAEAAIRAVIARHAVLRTHIDVRGEDLVLGLNPPEGLVVEREDLRPLGAAAETEADVRARVFCARVNPVEGQWLTRAKLFDLPGGHCFIAIACNHIVADAGSRNIVLDEVRDLLEGRALPPLALTYNDFSLAERDILAGPQGEALIDYWRRWYEEQPLLHAPGGTPLLWGTGNRIVTHFTMPRRILEGVQALAGRLGATGFLVHLTLFSLALARWSGAADFPIRILGDKRTSLDRSGLVGLMFCADAVSIHAPPAQDFETTLRGVRAAYDAALALRLPGMPYYPPHMVRPGIAPIDLPNRIPAVFNYYAAGTAREMAESLAAPDATAGLPWPPQVRWMPPAAWTRRSAPIFLYLMDSGAEAQCMLYFYADAVNGADQRAFLSAWFALYDEILRA